MTTLRQRRKRVTRARYAQASQQTLIGLSRWVRTYRPPIDLPALSLRQSAILSDDETMKDESKTCIHPVLFTTWPDPAGEQQLRESLEGIATVFAFPDHTEHRKG